MTAKRPNSRRNLDIVLERLVGKASLVAKRAIVANAIVAQMLPNGSVKGGSAIKMRLGDRGDHELARRGGRCEILDIKDEARWEWRVGCESFR